MSGPVWLASYPKSGNTWFRILASNLRVDRAPVDLEELPMETGMASTRYAFDYLSLIDSSLLRHEEIDRLRPQMHRTLAAIGPPRDGPEPAFAQFIKVHDAYTSTSTGEPLLGGSSSAKGAIVLVRDPRDIVASLAHHNRCGLDEAIRFMADRSTVYCGEVDRLRKQLRQKLFDWSSHVASWLDQSDIPVHLLRYEDLHADTVAAFSGALAFAGVPFGTEAVHRAAERSRFERLRDDEARHGFREAPHASVSFFRRGRAGGWREELSASQVARVERAHGTMMRRLGYSLAEGD